MTMKDSLAIEARIEWLGKLSDSHHAALEANDITGLEAVAVEYDKLNMTWTAKGIRIEISTRRKVKND